MKENHNSIFNAEFHVARKILAFLKAPIWMGSKKHKIELL